jgi:hypothetical protein
VDGRSSSPTAEVETLLMMAVRGGKVWLKVLMRVLMLSAEEPPALRKSQNLRRLQLLARQSKASSTVS